MSDLEKYRGHDEDDIVEASFTIDGEEFGPGDESDNNPEILELGDGVGVSLGESINSNDLNEQMSEEEEQSIHDAAEIYGDIDLDSSRNKPFRIKPIRTFILIFLLYGMYDGFVPLWLGIGILVIYFGIKLAIRRFIQRVLTIPFALKGKALAGAHVTVHGHQWTDKRHFDYEDELDNDGPPLRYVWIDVTITPPEIAPETQGFTHWEPAELMLCPSWYKIKKVSDLDVCLPVEDVQFIQGEGVVGDDEKVLGEQRIKLLVGIPEGQNNFQFVYYMEAFGEVHL